MITEYTQEQVDAGKNFVEKLLIDIKQFDEVKIKIAVTGNGGSGKSSLINILTGMHPSNEKAAKTGGAGETTLKTTDYPYPNNPNVIIVDLPGAGTPNFPIDNYFEKVEFEKYDAFILVTKDRFTEIDERIINHCSNNLFKSFIVIRTHVDVFINNQIRDKETETEDTIVDENQKKQFETSALEVIRKVVDNDISQSLEKCKIRGINPKCFLVCSQFSRTPKYDFPALVKNIIQVLPNEKKNVGSFTFVGTTVEQIEEKTNELYSFFRKTNAAVTLINLAPFTGVITEKYFLHLLRKRTELAFSITDETVLNIPLGENIFDIIKDVAFKSITYMGDLIDIIPGGIFIGSVASGLSYYFSGKYLIETGKEYALKRINQESKQKRDTFREIMAELYK